MIVAEQKSLDEIKTMLKGCKKVLAVGCGTCVTVCFSGGRQEVGILSASLRMSTGLDGDAIAVDESMVQRQCEEEFIAPLQKELEDYDAILSLGCGVGVQSLAQQFRVRRSFRHSIPNSWVSRPNTACGRNAARVVATASCTSPEASARSAAAQSNCSMAPVAVPKAACARLTRTRNVPGTQSVKNSWKGPVRGNDGNPAGQGLVDRPGRRATAASCAKTSAFLKQTRVTERGPNHDDALPASTMPETSDAPSLAERCDSNLARVLAAGEFAVTGEVGPPKGHDAEVVRTKARLLEGCVDAPTSRTTRPQWCA